MKWEDNVKTTLEKRTIKPSEASWNTLANRLDATEKKKSKVMYLWMSLAASVVAILFTITVFFNDTTFGVQTPGFVDTEQQIDAPINPIEKSSTEQLVKTVQDLENVESLEKNAYKKEPIKNPKNLITPTQQKHTVVKNDIQKPLTSLEIGTQKEVLEDQKVSEIVAHINDLKGKGQKVSDADIDALLRQAQKEITYQSILKESTRTVDANALLQDVEADLQQSFRNKIFEALKNSYDTVRTAVAERNN